MSTPPPRPSTTKKSGAKGGAGPRPARDRGAPKASRMPWLIAGLVVVIGLAAAVAVIGGGGGDSASANNEVAPVTATGTALPAAGGSGLINPASDPGVGKTVPALSGTTFGGSALSFPVPTVPTVYLFVAHWCPHCRAEVPRIVDWLDDGSLPKTVAWRTISTSVDSASPNYPPSAWLAKERWDAPVLVDSEKGDAAIAFGLKSFPYMVFVDAKGVVKMRATGELTVAEIMTGIAAITG
jgi:cytochrome c biogenesis protein CcmG/thiol:disulfide interchange protein DsbE